MSGAPGAMSDEKEKAAADGNDQPHVLVVDDDRTIRQLLRWALEDDGITVETAADGREALAHLAARQPQLLLLDMALPLVDGAGVADALHATYGTAVPIVAITADGRAAEKARRVGAQAYFHKPFDIDELIAAINRVLGRADQSDRA